MGKRLYNWTEIQKLYDTGISTLALTKEYGISQHAIQRAVLRGEFIRRPIGITNRKSIEQLSRADRIKTKGLQEGLFQNKCSECNQLPEHNGKPLVLQIHHIDGNRKNNTLDNLVLLCPNCHSQTETYAGRNKKS